MAAEPIPGHHDPARSEWAAPFADRTAHESAVFYLSAGSAPRLRALPRPRHTGRWIVLIALAVAGGVFGIVTLNALAAEAAFQARTLSNDVAQTQVERDELVAAVAALSDPRRVREVATGQLGMVAADGPTFLAPPAPAAAIAASAAIAATAEEQPAR